MSSPLEHLKHLHHLARHALRDLSHGKKRSSGWPTVRRHFEVANPTCAACGGTERIQVHHKKPFHLRPELELDMNNMISLCMGIKCHAHILIGHGDDYKKFNPNVESDAAEILAHPERRDAIATRAKANRLPIP